MTHNPNTPRGVQKTTSAKAWLKKYWWGVLLAVVIFGLLVAAGTDSVDFGSQPGAD